MYISYLIILVYADRPMLNGEWTTQEQHALKI